MSNWKPIASHTNRYEVSDEGQVRNKQTGLILKPMLQEVSKNASYYFVGLAMNGKYRRVAIHRLVAEAFCEHTEGRPQVNHIDANKLNNRASNLEWCTHQENMDHAKALGLFKSPKSSLGKRGALMHNSKAVRISKDEQTHDFESQHLASEFLGCKPIAVSRVANGKRSNYKGWTIAFITPSHPDNGKTAIDLGLAIPSPNPSNPAR